MFSIDTNILFFSLTPGCPEFNSAQRFMLEIASSRDVAICELVLVELYNVLRNNKATKTPLDAQTAVAICQTYRRHPSWKIIGEAPVMDQVWRIAAQENFARRQIFDARIAKTLQYHGVDEFATDNMKHFQDLGFKRVWNPLA